MDNNSDQTAEKQRAMDFRLNASLYDSLMKHRIYQDGLLWSRVQLVIAIQAAVIAGGYKERATLAGPLIMLLGAWVTFVVLLLILRDYDDSCVNQELMDRLADELVPALMKKEILTELGQLTTLQNRTPEQEKRFVHLRKYRRRFVWFSTPAISLPAWRRDIRGKILLSGTVASFILLDAGLFASFLAKHLVDWAWIYFVTSM